MTTNILNFTFQSEKMCPRVFVPSSTERNLIKILKSDDVNTFIDLISNFNSIDTFFSHNFFATNVLLCSSPPVASVAAFYAANNCLEYLINNGCNLQLKDSLGTPISHFAVAGGSLETVNILNNNNIPFDSSALFVAADCGNFEMFMWIYATQTVDLLKRKEDRTCLLHHAVKGKSWKLVKFLTKELETILNINDLLEINLMIQNSTLEDKDNENDSDNDEYNEEEQEENDKQYSYHENSNTYSSDNSLSNDSN